MAVELGTNLAAVLRRELAGSSVEVVVSAFEDWQATGAPFDTLTAFTSWHWLDPAVRAPKAAALLRPGGALATVTAFHVRGGTEDFFADVQDCYLRWDPVTQPCVHLPRAETLPPALLACISQLLDQTYGGTITKRYLHELRVAHKRPPL